VLDEVNERRTLVDKKMKNIHIKLIRHLLRQNKLISIVMKGKIKAKRFKRRTRKSLLKKNIPLDEFYFGM
jgi:predicted double-glycine peptidase